MLAAGSSEGWVWHEGEVQLESVQVFKKFKWFIHLGFNDSKFSKWSTTSKEQKDFNFFSSSSFLSFRVRILCILSLNGGHLFAGHSRMSWLRVPIVSGLSWQAWKIVFAEFFNGFFTHMCHTSSYGVGLKMDTSTCKCFTAIIPAWGLKHRKKCKWATAFD